MIEFLTVFLNVIMPVFGIVLLGFLLGRRLNLQAQTLNRVAYYVFVPAFIFHVISISRIPFASTVKMVVFIMATHLLVSLIAGGIGRLMRRSREMIAAFVMIAVFGNVGNFGLAVIRFRLGDTAVAPATIYFVVIVITAFIVCVGAAGWAHNGRIGALVGLLKTPALWAAVPALIVAHGNIAIPLMFSRMIGLLAEAMIPVMLFALGLQLLEQKRVLFSMDVMVATSARLLLAPAFACMLAIPFHLRHIEYAAGILQAAMPTAVLVAIISKEYDIVPEFVTSVVLISTLISLITLTGIMVLL
ncbi:MAG: AEC family transporter [Desulfobacterales bacterium]